MGISLAAISKIKGYNCKIVMPENMSEDRKLLIKNYGSDLILTDRTTGMTGAINKAKELLFEYKNSYFVDQFNNYTSVIAHETTTAPEIYSQTKGSIDVIFVGIGTGATICGLYNFFNEIKSLIEIVGVLPINFPHNIQGIGAGFNPPFLNNLHYTTFYVNEKDVFEAKVEIYKKYGLYVGLSSGAVLCAYNSFIKDPKNQNKKALLIFPDSGDRYEK